MILFRTYRVTLIVAAMLLSFKEIYSQNPQPGNVQGTKVWYVTSERNDDFFLGDSSGNKYRAFESERPKLDRSINFHPASMTKAEKVSLSNFSFRQGTIVGIFYPDPSPANFTGTDFIRVGENKKNIKLRYKTIDTSTNASKGEVEKGTKFPFGYAQKRNSFEQNAVTKKETAMKTFVYYKAVRDVLPTVWAEEKTIELFNDFEGYMPELIIYNRVLSPLERSKVETYLAIKFGITLDTSYINWNKKGESFWSITDPVLKTFHNRVVAIGKDKNAALWQPQSNTTYEELPFFSYETNSDRDKSIDANYKFIPDADSVSLFRSLTVAFKDKSMRSLPDQSLLFFGDNAKKVAFSSYQKADSIRFKGLQVVGRTWVAYNPQQVKEVSKITVAGKKYENSNLFPVLYQPYDYQLYRFLLLKLKDTVSRKIEDFSINSYFGREQLIHGVDFKTRTLVWDSIFWNHSSGYNFFTFGKVPLLNFLQVKNMFDDSIKTLGYPYYEDEPITTRTIFDTLAVTFDYRSLDSVLKLRIRTSVGVGKLTYRIYKLNTTNNTRTLLDSLIKPSQQGTGEPDPMQATGISTENTDTLKTDTEDNPSALPGSKAKPIKYIKRDTPVEEQAFIECKVEIPLIKKKALDLNSRFLLEVEDSIGQFTSLPIKIRKPKKTH